MMKNYVELSHKYILFKNQCSDDDLVKGIPIKIDGNKIKTDHHNLHLDTVYIITNFESTFYIKLIDLKDYSFEIIETLGAKIKDDDYLLREPKY